MLSDRLERFTMAERMLHWSNAFGVLFLGTTGAIIWQDLDDWRIAGINVLSEGHFWLGGGTVLVGAIAFLLLRRRRLAHAEARFNPLQRLNLRVIQAALVWMLATGTLLHFGKAWALSKPFRQSLKQVHLVSAAAVSALVLVHLIQVLIVPKNRGLLMGMVTGWVDRATAERASAGWVARLKGDAG